MAKLLSCPTCSSFVPVNTSECPNCRTSIVVRKRRMVGPLAMLGGGVLAMTLSACYGAADDYYPPEDTGTADTAADAAPDMGVDTGTADTGSGDTGSGDTGSGDAASDAAGDAASDAAGDV